MAGKSKQFSATVRRLERLHAVGEADRVAKAVRDLEQAQRILARPVHNLDEDGWLLLATLIGEADLIIRDEQRTSANLQVPLLEEIVADFREVTGNFTDPAFLRATRAARRRNKTLFSSPNVLNGSR